MHIELLTIGDELLDGQTVNSNAASIGRALDALGHRVMRVTTVRDIPADIEWAFRTITARADVCITSGGLGPTVDDLTVDGLMAVAGVGFTEDELAWANIVRRYGDRPIPPQNRRQIRCPEGATLLYSEVGTAPGVDMQIGRCRVFCTPGVPREMLWHLERSILPAIGRSGGEWVRRIIRVALLGESTAEAKVLAAGLPPEVEVGWRAIDSEVEIKLRGPEAPVLAAEAKLRDVLGDDQIGEHPDLVTATLAGCKARGWRLGAAESCTGGQLGSVITDVPGSSAVFAGSIVAYANEVKQGVLGVSAEILAAHGAVSEACAAAMAEGARRALGVDYAVSITGVAGPDGGSAEKPVGTVCFGFAGPDGTHTERRWFRGDRALVRKYAVAFALNGVRRATH